MCFSLDLGAVGMVGVQHFGPSYVRFQKKHFSDPTKKDMLKAVYGGLRNAMFYLKEARLPDLIDNAARHDEFSKEIF